MSLPLPGRPTVSRPRGATMLLAFFLATGFARAQSSSLPSAPTGVVETGVPSFVVLEPEAMGLSTAPTDLKLLPDGRILVISQNEIAFSDGVRWEVFRGLKGQGAIFNQVAVDRDGRIYAGMEGRIARIDFGEDARWRLTPVAVLPAEDAGNRDASMVAVDMVSSGWFWHGGTGAIIAWQPGQVARVVGNASTIERIFALGPDVFVSEQASGALFRLPMSKGGANRVEAAGHMGSETITSTVAFAPGRLLVGTNLAGLKLFDGTTFQPFGVSTLLGGNYRINDLCSVGAGLFAAAVDTVGIVIFDRAGHAVQVLDRSLDLRLARVLRLQYAEDGVLWALLTDGLVRMEFPSPLSHFEALVPSGLTFAKPLRHGGRLWLLADGRAMRGIYDANGLFERFEQDSPPGRFLFTLDDIDGELFASNDEGIFVHEATGWKLAVPGIVNARIGIARTSAAGLLYVAQGEFGYLQRTPAGFTARRIPVPGLGDNYSAVEDAAGIVWLELGTSRVARVDPHGAQPTLQIFGTKEGLIDGWVEIYVLDGVARFHVATQLFRFDEGAKRFTADGELLKRFPQFASAGGRPITDKFGRIWYTADGGARLIEPTAAGGSTVRSVAAGFAPTQYNVEDNGQVVWMFQNRRLVRMDLRVSNPPPRPLQALITSVQLSVSGRRFFTGNSILAPIAYADNSLIIHFVAPANPFATPVTFEVLLEGADNQWVSTGAVGSAAFNRLKEGHYVFLVRPVSAGAPGAAARLEFTVQPPWFRTTLAWVLYALATVSLLAFVTWFSSYLQRRKNERLEMLVAQRTKELNATNARLGRQVDETTEKSAALAASEERYRTLNTGLERRVQERTTELFRSREESQQRELLFRLIVEHAPVGISWKRFDLGNVYHVNPMFRRTLDLPADTVPDYALLTALVHPDDLPRQLEMNRLIESGQADSYNLEERFSLKDGRLVWVALSVTVVRDQSGRIIQDIAILEDITARKQAEQELAGTNRNLVEVSRTAGMAEVATSVLHNVGNVLNSVNVSATLVGDHVRHSKAVNLVKICELLDQHKADVGAFLNSDPKGQIIPAYLGTLASSLATERAAVIGELDHLRKNIEHIKDIVAMQQNYARNSGFTETVSLPDLIEDVLRMNAGSLARHEVDLVRDYQARPVVTLDKHKLMQILVNVVRNAKNACDESGRGDKQITVRLTAGGDRVQIAILDNGVGIPPENLARIFAHGFTTRREGHGFGLHSSALAAKELGGSLTVHSPGPGQGATFTLELPAQPETPPHAQPAHR